jgi:AraC family transcriptional regulator
MSRLISSTEAHQYLKARLTACSRESGWTSLLLRGYTDPPEVQEVRTAATGDQLVVLVTAGSCDLEVRRPGGWRRTRQRPGIIGMTAPGEEKTLRWRSEVPHSTLQLHLPGEALVHTARELSGKELTQFRLPSGSFESDPLLQAVISSLAEAMREGAPDLYAQAARELMIAHILVRYAGMPAPPAVNVHEERLRRADDFIRAHLESPLTLDGIAQVIGLSRFHTLRLFKSVYGETPIRRLTRLRMERAQLLLAQDGDSVTEVAFRCGYDNPAHFANAFRRFTGVTPTQFRRRKFRSQ